MATKLTLKERIHGALRRIVYPKGSTPLKWKEILILFFSLMSTAMSITMLFPFLPAMVKHFGKTEEETGYYAGLIASSMFFGRFLASYFWGCLADKVGRRPVLVISLFLLSMSMFAFGLSTSVVMAMLTRFCVGLSSGLLAIAKAIISELCDNTNQSLGMSTLTSAYSTGLVFGPALGGFLSEVGRKYPQIFPKDSFFARFPFMLPCLVDSVLLLAAMIITYLWLPETLAGKTQRVDSTEKEKSNKESKSFLLNSFNKKSGKSLTVESCDETKKKTQLSENSGKSEDGKEMKASDTCDTQTKSPSSGEDGLEMKEIHAVSPRQNDIKDGSCDSNNSKYSEQCTDGDINVKCDTDKMDKGTCTIRETDYMEKDEPSTRKYEAEEDELQTRKREGNKETLRTDTSTNSEDLSCNDNENDKEKRTQTCGSGHTKDPKETSSNTRGTALISAPCSSTKDSEELSTRVVDSSSRRSCCQCSCWKITKDSNVWRILRNFNAVLSLAIYSLYSLGVIGSEELFNIWGATDPRLGGLGFSTDDLGTAILVVGIAMILIQPTILPKLERRLGAILNFQICVMVIMFCVVTQPTLRIFVKRPSVLWPVLLIHKAFQHLSVSGAFLSCFLFINNSVRQELLCSVNGLAVSVCSLFRAFAPSVGGSLYAWSISSGYKLGFPFNLNLAFIFFGLVYLVTSSISCFLSESVNEPKGPKKQKPVPCLSCDNLLEAKT